MACSPITPPGSTAKGRSGTNQASATDLLFITLRKSEALFSPTTRYRDLASRRRSLDGGHPLADQRHPCSCRLLLLIENGLAAFPVRSTRQQL